MEDLKLTQPRPQEKIQMNEKWIPFLREIGSKAQLATGSTGSSYSTNQNGRSCHSSSTTTSTKMRVLQLQMQKKQKGISLYINIIYIWTKRQCGGEKKERNSKPFNKTKTFEEEIKPLVCCYHWFNGRPCFCYGFYVMLCCERSLFVICIFPFFFLVLRANILRQRLRWTSFICHWINLVSWS